MSQISEMSAKLWGDYNRVTAGLEGSEHKHSFYELSIIISGRLTVLNNGDRTEADAPCVIFHFPGTYHRIIASPEVVYERYNINFSAEVFKGNQPLLDSAEELYRSNVSLLAIDRDKLDELLYYVRPFLRAGQSRRIALLGVILDVLRDCRKVGFFPERRQGTDYVNGVIRYISDNLSPGLGADEIASEFDVSRAKLAADFKRETGMTLKEYVELSCIDRARMLLSTGVSVQAVSLEVGYQSVGTFIRAFKKLTGTTPGAYSAFCR